MSGATLASINVEDLRTSLRDTAELSERSVAASLLIVHLGCHQLVSESPARALSSMSELEGSMDTVENTPKESMENARAASLKRLESRKSNTEADSGAWDGAALAGFRPGAEDLVMVVPGSLQLRALFYPPPLTKRRITPAYFDAPSKHDLVVVFTYLDDAWDLQEHCPESFQEVN